jgi:hypothetical protein
LAAEALVLVCARLHLAHWVEDGQVKIVRFLGEERDALEVKAPKSTHRKVIALLRRLLEEKR